MSCGHMLFADDTGIGFIDHNDMSAKLITYNNAAAPSNFLVNWEAVFYING